VDAFTAEPFKGNPAAVCLLQDAAKAADERWMQWRAQDLKAVYSKIQNTKKNGSFISIIHIYTFGYTFKY